MIVCPLLFSVVVVIVLSKDTVYASLFGFVIPKDFNKEFSVVAELFNPSS